MKLSLMILASVLFSASGSGCSKANPGNRNMPGNNTPDDPAVPIDTTRTFRFLALGDSYTIGQSVEAFLRFPAQTIALLRHKGLNVVPPEYIATTGWTTQNLQSAIQSVNPQGPYQVVTLLIGVNDQYQGSDTGSYRPRFTQLLQKSIQLAGDSASHVFVLSIPDYSVTPFASGSNKERISQAIDAFNNINKQITLQYRCHYLDITPSTRQASSDPSLIAGDGLHPSGNEYRKWAAALGPLVLAVLR